MRTYFIWLYCCHILKGRKSVKRLKQLFILIRFQLHSKCQQFSPGKYDKNISILKSCLLIDWLIDWLMVLYVLFFVPYETILLKLGTTICRWGATKLRTLLGASAGWSGGRSLYVIILIGFLLFTSRSRVFHS